VAALVLPPWLVRAFAQQLRVRKIFEAGASLLWSYFEL